MYIDEWTSEAIIFFRMGLDVDKVYQSSGELLVLILVGLLKAIKRLLKLIDSIVSGQ